MQIYLTDNFYAEKKNEGANLTVVLNYIFTIISEYF